MRRRILVVDDEPSIRELVVDFLTDEGFAVESARDGREGIEKFETSTFDAVIADIMMPRMDGIDLLKTIRSSSRGSSIPVILMSAVDSLNGHADEVTSFLHKPFDISVLLERLDTLLPRGATDCGL